MSLTKDKVFMEKLNEDIEKLSKSLYLDNPDLWVEFLDISSDKKFDEMSLFFATKFDMLSIVKYSIEENKFNLDLPSKNKSFSSIRENLIDVAIQESSTQILAYLSGEVSIENNNDYIDLDVKYICTSCNSNIFKSGYNVLISSTCTYSPSGKKIIRSSPKELETVICSNCNKELKDVTPLKLECITNIENCINCGSHIPTVGILKEINVCFNSTNKTFEDGISTYCCKCCRNTLENGQLEHFNLI